jgi:spore coat protein U-like protein
MKKLVYPAYLMLVGSMVALVSILVSSLAAAQTQDGSLGATSTGQIQIDLEILDSVEITSLDTIDFGQYGGASTGDVNQGDSFCVYVNGGDDYTITPTSSNGADSDGDFVLIGDNDGDEIKYTVRFVGAATGASSASNTTYNTASSTFQGSVRRDCNSSDNASLDINIAEQEMRDATTDTYTDTLILLVNPV